MPFQFLRHLSKQILLLWQHNVSPKLLPLLSAIRIGGLLLAAFSLWAFAAIAEEVLEKETNNFDTEILLTLKDLHQPILDRVMVGITTLGNPDISIGVCLGVTIGLSIGHRRAQATTLAIAGLGVVALNNWLKVLFARARPTLWERIVDVRSYSFPSGHAMISLVIYGAIGYLLASQFRRQSRLIITLTTLLISAIGFSRLYLGVHWPTDVIAGYAAGLVWLLTCILSWEIWKSRKSPDVISPDNLETQSDRANK